ncbi:carboxylesterase/lipase family protein [Agromyces bauzanensis]
MAQRPVYVDTPAGALKGFEHRGVVSFLGVPYGASTAGANRFRPPQPVEPWDGVRDARQFGPSAPQNDSRLHATGRWVDALSLMYPRTGWPVEGGAMNEDCLVLNAWTPSADDGVSRPVMVWLHGGGFDHGSGGEMLCSGDELAAVGDVVVVTLNHRIGLLGFLPIDRADSSYAHSGVAGMLDIVQALEWVRDNIHLFGGDKDNVTIFGQSGGGAKVNTLMAMPAARGLFHKAINQSGVLGGMPAADDSNELLDAVLDATGLERSEAARLAELPMEELLDIQDRLRPRTGGGLFSLDGGPSTGGAGGVRFSPRHDDVHLPHLPFDPIGLETDDIPMLIGFTSHEATPMLCNDPEFEGYTEERLRDRLRASHGDAADAQLDALKARYPGEAPGLLLARVVTEVSFKAGAIGLARTKAARSAPVYMYEFGYQLPMYDNLFGAPHSGELPFVFRTAGRSPFAGDRPDRVEVSTKMALAWAAFARTGNPHHPGIPEWRPYTAERRTTMFIDSEWRCYEGQALDRLGPVQS